MIMLLLLLQLFLAKLSRKILQNVDIKYLESDKGYRYMINSKNIAMNMLYLSKIALGNIMYCSYQIR